MSVRCAVNIGGGRVLLKTVICSHRVDYGNPCSGFAYYSTEKVTGGAVAMAIGHECGATQNKFIGVFLF